jgi:hypothetical protein
MSLMGSRRSKAFRRASNPFDQFDAPAQPAAANPFNRQMGGDQSFGAPLGPAPIPPGLEDLGGEARAALGGPLTDRAVSAFQTYAPAMFGGNDRAYAGNLAENRAATEQAQAAHPADAAAGSIAGAIPYAVLGPGRILGAAVARARLPGGIRQTGKAQELSDGLASMSKGS